jgi:hypothetical protein
MLTGWVCLYLFLVYVLTHGGKIQGWHSAVWLVATFVGTWVVARGLSTQDGGQKTEDGGQKTEGGKDLLSGIRYPASGFWRGVGISAFLSCLAVLLPLAFSWVLSHFTDFSWDGMTSRGITVRNLMKGDPALNAYPFGHVLAGFLAYITGNWQGGKGINLTLIWICFCFVFPALRSLNFSGWSLWFLSVVTALNPVAVYQISCFQIDGHVASLVTCLIYSMLRILAMGPIALDGVLALVAAFVGSAACKTSGVFYAIIIDGIFLLFLAVTSRSWKRVLLLLGVALAVNWPLGVYIRSIGQIALLDLQYLRTSTRIETPGYGVGGGASQVEALKKMDQIQQFVASSFAMTESLPDQLRIKPPFWMTRRELRVFEELTPDPRAGGFGPLFSTGLLLSGAGCLLLALRGSSSYWPGWFLFLATAASSFGSQVWWARWTPQNWLLLIAMVMTVLAFQAQAGREKELDGEKVQKFKGLKVGRLEGWKVGRCEGGKDIGVEGLICFWVRLLGGFACLAAGVNVFLVTLYYFVGMGRQENVLNRQIELAENLGKPISIHLQPNHDGSYFLASELWFTERGLQVERLEAEPDRPRMKLNKTNTRFPLPQEWRRYLKDPKDEVLFRKRGCVED